MDRLRAEHITKSFDGTTIIQDVSLTLHEDELICLLGVSGVGKSTFFNVLSGLVVPDSGRVLLGEEDITGQTGRISYMQQKDLLLPHKRIVDNIALPLVLKGVPRKQARQQVSSGLAEFGLEGTERKYPGQLSGGMRQRAALYRTYLFNSEVAPAGRALQRGGRNYKIAASSMVFGDDEQPAYVGYIHHARY